jgi:hypothetical protein
MEKQITVKIENGKLPSLILETGQSVIWQNCDNVAHQINSNLDSKVFKFDIGIIFPGEFSSPVLFDVKSPSEGFSYGCGLVPDLSATIHVGVTPAPDTGHDHGHDHGHGHDHLKHFHGFVTGGRTGDQIYMTHTPIFSDERHHFQIILQASFAEKKHKDAYEKIRNSEYGSGKIQLFFDHVALIDIQSGELKELTADHLRYYPDVPTIREGLVMPGVSTKLMEFAGAIIKIDKVLHFRKFEPDMAYPENMTYLMYGNGKDVFIDHFISRAPNFHSVAKLAEPPLFWSEQYFNTTLKIQVPSRKIIDVSQKNIKRVAFLDNQTHLIWGIPSGAVAPVDPLEREEADARGNRIFDILLESGEKGKIEISHLLHFDAIRLLNEGLGF